MVTRVRPKAHIPIIYVGKSDRMIKIVSTVMLVILAILVFRDVGICLGMLPNSF